MQKSKPIVALIYDFDKTLSPKDMQEYTFIPGIGMEAGAFWEESNRLKHENQMDSILAYMYLMLKRADAADRPITRDAFVEQGKRLEFFPGVEGWFGRVNQYGAACGVQVEHYIISSGLKEFIEGCAIYRYFKEVYACEFFYDASNVARWPKNVVNYTTKTQFLFRINKDVLEISNDDDLNKFTPEDERPVPFRNMIYIGDGLTDVPCMKLVKVSGGYSIAVYPAPQRTEKAKKAKAQVDELLRDGRVNFTAPADYCEDNTLDRTVKLMIRKIAEADALCRLSAEQRKEISI